MAEIASGRPAWGGPGIDPRWTRSAKEGVGTAYSGDSRVWFTLSSGIVNEVYYPTIDRPQIRDIQCLVTDGSTFFHDERRHTRSESRLIGHHALGFRIVNTERDGRYRIVKQVLSDPHAPCLLQRIAFDPAEGFEGSLRLFVLIAPHLEGIGRGNTGSVTRVAGRTILTAHRGGTWLAAAATVPFLRTSAGYVGTTDGWTDLADDFEMDWDFDSAADGNVALTGEIDLEAGREFTLGVAFGSTFHAAVTTLLQSLAVPFERKRERFKAQWGRACKAVEPLEAESADGGELYHCSHSLLLAHEDKTYPGAMIASLSIPWGDYRGDEDLGGYHLVWTRDLVNSTTALLSSGNTDTPLRALVYLAAVQRPDGGFHQNFWLDGTGYWTGVQLDEAAFPILLAWRLSEAGALDDFDPYPMVLAAAGFLVREGPSTPQERWEENSGYSPSTLASNIAALTCAACMARERGDEDTGDFLQDYADFLRCHVVPWTVTGAGDLVPGIPRHFIRINPVDPGNVTPDEDPDRGIVPIRNRPPGADWRFPAPRIVDAGFLELVRYGIFPAGDPLFEDSLEVVDRVLRVETPFGPCWHRYNHDGYGQRDDGGPFLGWGRGRAWPLLTGERGHYELAAGSDPAPFIRAMEGFARTTGLLPEQVWDADDRPGDGLYLGGPTGSAMPLAWAHGEYVKLLRSARDGRVFDCVPAVRDRYVVERACDAVEVWKFGRQPRSVPAGWRLRVQAPAAFRLRWSPDGWDTVRDVEASSTAVGIHYVDLVAAPDARAPLAFTFFWTAAGRWEGRNFEVAVAAPR